MDSEYEGPADLNSPGTGVYASMIAGSIPAFQMDIEDAIVTIAGGIFHDSRVHLLTARDGDHVFYLAAPSAAVTQAAEFSTALAAALPGQPGYAGDGIYALSLGAGVVAVVKQAADFHLWRGDKDAFDSMARDRGSPVHVLTRGTNERALTSVYSRQRRAMEHMGAKLTRVCLTLIATCAALYILLLAGEKYLAGAAKDADFARQAGSVASRLQYASPLFEQLAHFQQISATVVRAGGWIEGYVWKPGKDESFEIVLPGWISRDYIDALGEGTVADYNVPENLVVARKGDLEKAKKP